MIANGVEKRLRRENDERAWLAHTTALLHHVDPKKFPKLTTLLSKPKRAMRNQTPEEMLGIWRGIIAAYEAKERTD